MEWFAHIPINHDYRLCHHVCMFIMVAIVCCRAMLICLCTIRDNHELLTNQPDKIDNNRINSLRAAVLGVNDDIVSITGFLVGNDSGSAIRI